MPFRIGNRVNFQAWLNNLYRNDIGWFTFAGTPTSGTSGTLAGFAGPGCLLWDTTNKALYVNSGTKASPSWTYSSAAAATKTNFSNTTVSAGYATDTYLAGSAIAVPAGIVAGATYGCTFDMVKTGAGTAAFTVTLRYGTAGTVADAAIITWAFSAGTANADTGTFRVEAHFRSVGSGTSAVVVGLIECSHQLAVTGLVSTGASGYGSITTVSSGFNSTPAGSIIGLSVNGGASFSGTNTTVEAQLRAY